MTYHQLNVSIPESLYKELQQLVPPGQRTRFLVQLTETGLHQLRLKKALDHSYGAWTKHAHPELAHGVEAYVRSARKDRGSKRRG